MRWKTENMIPACFLLILLAIPCDWAWGDIAPKAPPPSPPLIQRQTLARTKEITTDLEPSEDVSLYSIGQPTDEEQQFVEYINSARADAGAEAQSLMNTDDSDVLGAYSYFSVDLDMMTNQFATLEQHLPPLSINSNLTAAARLHTLDMFNNVFQGHISSTNPPPPNQPGDTLGERLTYQGYNYYLAAENVFSYSRSIFYGHAGFEVDWGFGPDGMQDPPGHRENIHNSSMREIGIGVLWGSNSTSPSNEVGPMLVTQEFGARYNSDPFITGVAFYDLDSNAFYDPGEGIGGLRVDVENSSYYSVTADSGGYSVPVASNGTYTVTFSGPNLTPFVTNLTVSLGENEKLDYVPDYSAPTISGPTNVSALWTNNYLFSALGGAVSHTLRRSELSSTGWVEGAETGTNYVLIESSPGYDPIQSQKKYSGSYAFHLAHPDGNNQNITLLRDIYLPSTNAVLEFQSSLGWASTNQEATVSITLDEGASWLQVYSQVGDDSSGESGFHERRISLADYSGDCIQIRFSYKLSGIYYNQTEADVGWVIDDISVQDSLQVLDMLETSESGGEFNLAVPSSGSYLLQVRGNLPGHIYPYGPGIVIEVDPLLLITDLLDSESGRLEIKYKVLGGNISTSFLQTALQMKNGFTNVPGLVPDQVDTNSYRLLYTPDQGIKNQFFRVLGE